jgi:hypothetical protein
MTDLVCILDRWQTLIGSLLGGFFALATALIVAQSATRREQRVAAMLLTADALAIYTTANKLKSLAEEKNISDEKYPLWVSEKLSLRRPRLSSLFDAQMARMIDVDDALAAHLSFVKMIYSSIDDHIGRIEQDMESRRTEGLRVAPRSTQAMEADAVAVADSLALAAEHAACAQHLLAVLVLSPVPRFIKRIRMWLRPSERELLSKSLLENGHI